MKSGMRAWIILALVATLCLTLSAGTLAAPGAQILQATATSVSAQGGDSAPKGQDMTVMKAEANKQTALPGEEVRFSLQVKSTGTMQLEGPRIIADFPAGLEVLSASTTRGKVIDNYQGHVDIEVVNLASGDVVDVTIVAKVKPEIVAGTGLVANFKVNSAYVGTQNAAIGVAVGAEEVKKALPQTGGGIALILLGVVLAGGALAARRIRVRPPVA